jgi:Tol biopolymer transport system component
VRARRFSSLALSVLIVAALAALPAGRGTEADAQVRALDMGGEVAFATFRDGDFEIYAMAPDGSAQRNLSRAPNTADLDPAWSPDGARIAFSRYLPGNPTSEVYVMNADGTGKVRLTQDDGRANDREPAWNSAGTRIAFTRTVPAKGSSRILLMWTDGSNRRRLTGTSSPRYDSSPVWSPRASRIAFVSNRAGGFPEIWAINSDGTGLARLTDNGMVDASPAWSPDGTRIAFERCCPDGSSELYVINADGTGEVRVTTTPANETEPTWAPDGSSLAFVVFPPGGGNPDVHAVNLDGTGERLLTDGATADLTPDWRREAPTPEPTPTPSAEPTPTPSAEPSPSPSGDPTPTPSVEPSPSPTSDGAGAVGVGTVRASGARVRAAPRPRYRTLTSRRVVPGLRYRKILDRRGPNRIYVLRMNPRGRPALDMALAGGDLPGFARTSRMAATHRAVAAVNGDFALPSGRPTHPFAEDGFFHQTSFHYSHNVAMSHREDTAYFRHPIARLSVRQIGSGDVLRIDRWNTGDPTWGEVAAYTPPGGSLGRPPPFACSARLQPAGPRRWAQGERGVSRDYVVDDAGCRATPMYRRGGVVVAAQPGSPEALLIRSLVPGETVALTWSFGWAGVAESIGGYPLLLRKGQTTVTGCSASICARHPRTAIGVDRAGRLLLVVVDGRRRRSVGMTLLQLAKLMRRLGAASALNLDGGGSSTMVVRGRIVNRPSDGSERAVSTAVLVIRGADRGERIEGTGALALAAREATQEKERSAPGRGAVTEVGGASPGIPALLDPASTGGMLDAVDRELFGARRSALSPALRLLLGVFRSSG